MGLLNFKQTPYVDPSTGQTYRAFDMSRDGFALLAMGFTGAKALKFKIAYIEAFNTMEARLQGFTDPIQVLGDPKAMRGLLLVYSEKVLALEDRVAEMAPTVEAFERIADAEGSFCITDGAKTLQVQPKVLFSFLRSHRWIYTRAGGSSEIAYQDKLASGLLAHKTTTVERSDGSEKVITQVRITPKGLTRLARELAPAMRVA
jgi:phage antirepressor YoqD-like protein